MSATPFEHVSDALFECLHRAEIDEREVLVTVSFETPQGAHRFRRMLIDMHRHHMVTHNPPGTEGRGFMLNGIRYKLEVRAREVPLP